MTRQVSPLATRIRNVSKLLLVYPHVQRSNTVHQHEDLESRGMSPLDGAEAGKGAAQVLLRKLQSTCSLDSISPQLDGRYSPRRAGLAACVGSSIHPMQLSKTPVHSEVDSVIRGGIRQSAVAISEQMCKTAVE